MHEPSHPRLQDSACEDEMPSTHDAPREPPQPVESRVWSPERSLRELESPPRHRALLPLRWLTLQGPLPPSPISPKLASRSPRVAVPFSTHRSTPPTQTSMQNRVPTMEWCHGRQSIPYSQFDRGHGAAAAETPA